MTKHNAHYLAWRNRTCYSHVAKHPAFRDNANCTVKAVKNAFGLSWVKAYEECKADGRPHGNGYCWAKYQHTVRRLAKERGLKLEVLKYRKARQDYGKTVLSAQRRLTASETVFFNVRGHTMSFNKGYTNDWADGRRHHVLSVWRLACK